MVQLIKALVLVVQDQHQIISEFKNMEYCSSSVVKYEFNL